MPAPSNPGRIVDIEAAIKRSKARDRLTLDDLASIWGTTKPRFVTVRNQMTGFPDAVDKEGNQHIYPAIRALKAMLRHERRHDDMVAMSAQRRAAIVGGGRGQQILTLPVTSAQELATLSRLSAEVEERERDQGEYVPRAEVARVVGDVFSEISDLLSRLSNKVDPKGMLPVGTRVAIDAASKEQLLRSHNALRDMLSPDAQPRGNRKAPGRTRKS